MKKTTAIFPIALVAMPLLTGCGSSDEASFDDPTTDQSADAGIDVGGGINVDDGTESAGESSTAQTSSESSNSRGADPILYDPDPDDVIASYSIEVDGDLPDGSTVTIGVHSIQVLDDLLFLELYFTPDVPADTHTEWSIYQMNEDNAMRPALTDRENLTQYLTIRGGADAGYQLWASETVYPDVASGDTLTWWGYYTAPPEGVDSLELRVLPEHPPIELELQR